MQDNCILDLKNINDEVRKKNQMKYLLLKLIDQLKHGSYF
jgi:hypothetical protein